MDTITWIFLYLLLPILFGVLGNIATPWVVALLSKGNLSLREKRIVSLKKEYQTILGYKQDNSKYIVRLLLAILAYVLAGILTLVYVGFFIVDSFYRWNESISVSPWTGYTFFLFVFVVIAYVVFYYVELNNKVNEFDKYKERVKEKIIKLGGNLEELDKEESSST